MENMIYYVDIDGTICDQELGKHYSLSKPYKERIEHFNELFDQGHEIHYWTARGQQSKIDYTELTKQQLKDWGVKYTSLKLGKPHYDLWIDDKSRNANMYFEQIELDKE
jgi:uncharacterized HAD superfamily protein